MQMTCHASRHGANYDLNTFCNSGIVKKSEIRNRRDKEPIQFPLKRDRELLEEKTKEVLTFVV